MKRYIVERTERGVTVSVQCPDGFGPLRPRLDLRSHSPTGFEYGYHGSGPAQLALALLADAVDDGTALALYQTFKRAVVGAIVPGIVRWEITSEWICGWAADPEVLKASGASKEEE